METGSEVREAGRTSMAVVAPGRAGSRRMGRQEAGAEGLGVAEGWGASRQSWAVRDPFRSRASVEWVGVVQ